MFAIFSTKTLKKGDRMKAEVDPLHVVVGAAILLIVLVVSIIIFTKFYGDQTGIARCEIANLKLDCDCDGIKNSIDKCPCIGENTEDCQKKDHIDKCMNSEKCVCDPPKDCSKT